jgi:hypothetical protein
MGLADYCWLHATLPIGYSNSPLHYVEPIRRHRRLQYRRFRLVYRHASILYRCYSVSIRTRRHCVTVPATLRYYASDELISMTRYYFRADDDECLIICRLIYWSEGVIFSG